MVTMYHFKNIRSLAEAGLSDSEISRRLKIDRATVRKYRESNTPPSYAEREKPTRENPLKGYEEVISNWIATRKDLSATSIFMFIKDQGYAGSLRTVERRVASLKANLPKERFFEQVYTPGEQAQFDFKEAVTIAFRQGSQLCQIFVATLPCSGRFFAKAFSNKTYEAFADGMHSFFEDIGGMTKAVRFDNLSPVVKKVLKGNERIYTPAFQRALSYYGFNPLPCAPAKGSDKGDCERDIRTFSRRMSELLFLSGRTFIDFDDLNAWLIEFSHQQLTDKQSQAFAEEALQLKTLPPRDEATLCQVHTIPVNKHGTVRLKRSSFSVPDYLIQQTVKVVVSAFDIKIYQLSPRLRLVATHPRIADNTSSILLEHTISSLVRKPQAMVRWSHRAVLFPHPIFKKYYSYLQKTMPYGAEATFLKSLNLIHHASLSEIILGVEIVLENKSSSPFSELKDLLLRPTEFHNASLGVLTTCQPPLNTELSHYDSLIPK